METFRDIKSYGEYVNSDKIEVLVNGKRIFDVNSPKLDSLPVVNVGYKYNAMLIELVETNYE